MTGLSRRVVIGVGNEFRGDDGAGPAAVARLQGRVPADVELVTSDGEPTRLLEAWSGASVAIVVDAVAGTPSSCGRLHRIVLAEHISDEPIAGSAGLASWHGFGLETAVDLGRMLGRLPDQLIVHGIEATNFGQGPGLSPAVAAAIGDLAAAVLADLD